MEAISADSLSDMLATSVVIISMLVSRFTSFQIDGYCGMAVACFIIFAGFRSAKETISPLLGQVPDKEFVSDIEKTVMSYPEIIGIHDLIVHDYGPGRVMISLHAEVDENSNLLEIHDVIDNVEKHLSEKFGCNTVIHMDPVSTSDDTVKRLKNLMNDFAKSNFGEESSIHDFRIVKGHTHTNLIFDIVIPFSVKLTDEQIREKIDEYLKTFDECYFSVVTIDRSYV